MRQHWRLRSAVDRNAKKARCACGWEGEWRATPSTGRRRHDVRARYRLIAEDFKKHLAEKVDKTF